MAKKTISNTFTVNTIQDGDDAVVATCSPDKISIQCNADGSVVSTTGYSVSFGLKVGSIDISQYITNVTRGSLPTGVSISSTPVAYAKTIVVSETATATGMASGITFTVSASYSGKTYSANVTVALIGAAKGGVGERGKVGRFFYYARDWDASNNSDTFLINDATTPFFSNAGSDSKHYYVFNKFFDDSQNHYLTMKDMADASEKVGGQIDWNKAPWQVMTDDIKYLITEAIFTDFAKLGSFIVSGDWLISTNGTINGTAYVNGASYYGAPAYTWFDPAYPNTDHTKKVTIGGGQQVTVHNFIPNLAFDGRTGTTYQQDAHIKGEIIATSGSFTGVVHAAMMYGTQLTVNNPNTSVKKYALDLVNHPANLFMCDPTMGNLVIVLPQAGDYDGITIRFFANGITASKTVTLQTYNSSVELYFKDMDNYVVGSWQSSNAMKMLKNEPYEASAINGVWYITQGIGKYGTYVS